MAKQRWTSVDIRKLFRIDSKIRSIRTIHNAEERGDIPKAKRTLRGKVPVREWQIEDLPIIGKHFGFIKKPTYQNIFCVYTAKGGVLKTTLAYTLARIFALNGIRTLIVGLDIQCSITDITLPPKDLQSLEDSQAEQYAGLYHFLYDQKDLNQVIQKTSLPTLDIIPETPDLNLLEKKLRLEPRREYLLLDKLIPHLSDYDVIIFDNGPSWNQLIESALTAANIVLSPIGCDIGTYQALQTNLATLIDFQQAMQLDWKHFFLIPTLLEKTKLSRQIYGRYLSQYAEQIISNPIRRGAKGQEAFLLYQSIIEHDPTAPLANDYYELITELWERVTQEEGISCGA